MSGESPGPTGLRLQIALAFTTGVLVISATAGATILLASPSGPPPPFTGDGFAYVRPSRPPTPSAAPATEAPPSPSPSPSTKAPPVKTPPSTKPPVVLMSMACDTPKLVMPGQTVCTIALSGPAPGTTSVSLEADTRDISLEPDTVEFAAGASSATFVAKAVAASGAPTTISASLGGVTKTVKVTVTTTEATP